MKFLIERAENYNCLKNGSPCEEAYKIKNDWYIEINDLESLMKLIEKVSYSLIIDENKIIIYDGYI